MTLEELFQKLSYGPLANLAMGGDGSGGIKEEKKPSVVLYANDALLRLHTRFVLAERSLTIQQIDGIGLYELKPENSHSASLGDNPPATIPFIQDTLAKPFQDDIIKIRKVYNSFGGKIPLNDTKACGSYFTPENHILQVPCPSPGELTTVVYQARHPKLRFNPASKEQTITIPSTLEEALIAYISYLHYSSMNGAENVNRATEYLNRYNTICNEVESHGVVNTDDGFINNKLEQRGFA